MKKLILIAVLFILFFSCNNKKGLKMKKITRTTTTTTTLITGMKVGNSLIGKDNQGNYYIFKDEKWQKCNL